MTSHDNPSEPSPEAAPEDKRELVGYVWVDSGQLIVTDPNYIEQLDYEAISRETNRHKRSSLIMDGLAIALRTGIRNGKYPVYVKKYENGSIRRVEIEMDEGFQE